MHSIKTQVEIGADTKLIYSTEFAKGSVHNFNLFKHTDYDFTKEVALLVWNTAYSFK